MIVERVVFGMPALEDAAVGDIVTFDNILFVADKASILETSFAVLKELADYLKAHPGMSIEVKGYTNSLGDGNEEQILSQARAESVRAYLMKQGIQGFRIVPVGYGSLFSKAGEVTQGNRKVDIRILKRD